MTGSRRVVMPMPVCDQALIEHFQQLMQHGRLKAVIDRTYSLDEIISAYRYVESARKTGIVVISNDQTLTQS